MAEISKKKKDRLKERVIEEKKVKKAQRKQVQEVSKEKDEGVKEAIAKKNKDEIDRKKAEAKKADKSKKLQHYFRIDRVETKKLEGWKVVKITDKKIISEVAKNQDVVLMEK